MNNENAIEIIPEAQFLNFLGQFLLTEQPNRDMIEAMVQIANNVDLPGFKELGRIAMVVLKDGESWKRFENIYNHHFLIPAACALPLYSSQLYYSRIKPDFYDRYLDELGLRFKQEGRKFPDHIGNELILLSIIISVAITEDNPSIAKIGREMLRKFFIPHLDPINGRLKKCTCDNQVNLYKPLFNCIMILYEEAKNIFSRLNSQ